MIKAVLLDFDGTLVDSLSFYIKAYDRALKKFGIKFLAKEIVNHCFAKKVEVVCQNLKIDKVAIFKKTYFGSVNKLHPKAQLFPGVLNFLKLCHQKHTKLGIITFAYQWYINRMIKKLKIKKYFNLILSANDVTHNKPHPEMVLKACKKLKVSTSSTLVVGDSKGDILMAKAAGCKTALFFPEKHKLFYNFNSLKKTHPDYIFTEFSNLPFSSLFPE